MKNLFKLFICLLAVFSNDLNGRAQGFLIDQQDTPASPPNFIAFWNLAPAAFPVGQEFVPTLSSLDFVDLLTYGGGNANAAATFQVLIHADNITGTVIGTSNPIGRTDGSSSVTHFNFPSSVSLSSGDTYVLELMQTASDGTTLWSLGSDPLASYANGRMIYSGQPNDNYDLWFDEGVTTVPEPNSCILFFVGVAVVIFCKSRKRFFISK